MRHSDDKNVRSKINVPVSTNLNCNFEAQDIGVTPA